MNLQRRTLGILGAMTFAATLAVAADATLIKPTSTTPYPFANGIAPNGIDADTTGIFFTQPYKDGLQSPRGIYSITPAGAVALVSTIPTGVTAENGIAIVPTPAGSGFTAGDKFAGGVSTSNSANDAVYRNGSSTPFIDNITSVLSHHQTAIQFDGVGSWNGELIVTSDTTISVYSSAGATGTLLHTYTGPAGFVFQASTVAPTTYLACPGCIFVTAMPTGNINNPTPAGNGELLTVAAGAANGPAVLFATLTGIPEPESIQFVTTNSGACNVGTFSFFAAGYATDGDINNPSSTSGAILAWTQAQIAPFAGHYLVQNEEITGGGHGEIYVDAGLVSQSLFSSTVTAATPTGYQLEDTAIIQCAATTGTGCPATQGFWHKGANWPHVNTTVDGVVYNGATNPITMVIGSKSYTQAQLLLLMPSGGLHSGAFANSLSQFIAAVLNVAAGAQVTPAANAAITGVNAALLASGLNIFGPGPSINSNFSAATRALVESYETALDNYNSAVGLGCTEGSGLSTGSGKKNED
jgi:hypothetical protein